jgi:hypothetical protein
MAERNVGTPENRRILYRIGGAGIQLAPSVGQWFGDVCVLTGVASAMVFFGLVEGA